jgi:hypothetical protein
VDEELFDDLDFSEPEDDLIDAGPTSEAIADREARLASTREELAEARAALAAARDETAEVLERYRQAILAANPELPEEMLQAGTLATLEASHEAAIALVEDVRRGLANAPRVPAGSPGREGAAVPATAGDKIRLGLSLR